jgi:hypothetical protein
MSTSVFDMIVACPLYEQRLRDGNEPCAPSCKCRGSGKLTRGERAILLKVAHDLSAAFTALRLTKFKFNGSDWG